ncbi:MAG: hypothetical protein ACREP9_12675 [Candidatus Dormibacteraceae bacterium]
MKLLRVEELSGPQTKAAARVLSSGTRMKQMSSDLLDFASLHLGGALPMTATRMDLGKAGRLSMNWRQPTQIVKSVVMR